MDEDEKALYLLFHPEVYPGLVKKNIEDRKVLLWRNHLLGDFCSWSIFVNDGEFYIRRVKWEQRFPYKQAEPETFGLEAIFPLKYSDHILRTLEDSVCGLDLENYGIKPSIDGICYGIITPTCKVEWSNNLSSEAKKLSDWHEATIAQCESFLA